MSLFRFLSWFERRRRDRLCRGPFPESWARIVETRVRHWRRLPSADRRRLEDAVRIFVAEKSWEGCAGLAVTDEIRVTIAAQACLLALGFEGFFFDDVRSILIYPATFLAEHEGVQEDRIGEAVEGSTVVLSWDDVESGGGSPDELTNVVFHEFAHVLDMMGGDADGTPVIDDPEQRARFDRVIDAEFDRHVEDEARDRESVISFYGTTDRSEFFAVATEAFFQYPVELECERAELYRVLAEFYCQDPARTAAPHPAFASRGSGEPREPTAAREELEREREHWDAAIDRHPRYRNAWISRAWTRLDLDDENGALADFDAAARLGGEDYETLLGRALVLERGADKQRCADAWDGVLELAPEDLSALVGRALARRDLGDLDAALAGLDQALRIDPENAEALGHRGEVRLERGDARGAIGDCDAAIRLDPELAHAWDARAEAWEELGKPRRAARDRRRADALWAAIEGDGAAAAS